MERRWKWLAAMLCAMFLLLPATAAKADTRTSQLTIQLTDSGENLSPAGVKFGLAKCASLTEDGWQLDPSYADANLDLNTETNWDQAAKALEPTARKLADTFAVTDENGTAVVSGLDEGMYLIFAADTAGFESITPALVAVPLFDSMTGSFSYNVIIEPKHSPYPLLLINKTDSQTKKNILQSAFEFSSFSDAACKNKLLSVQGNEKDGTAAFPVTDGTVYIKETIAPKGYVLSDETVKVEKTGNIVKINGKVLQDKEGIYSITYENRKPKKPATPDDVHTAALTENLSLFGGLALITLAMLAILQKKSQRS